MSFLSFFLPARFPSVVSISVLVIYKYFIDTGLVFGSCWQRFVDSNYALVTLKYVSDVVFSHGPLLRRWLVIWWLMVYNQAMHSAHTDTRIRTPCPAFTPCYNITLSALKPVEVHLSSLKCVVVCYIASSPFTARLEYANTLKPIITCRTLEPMIILHILLIDSPCNFAFVAHLRPSSNVELFMRRIKCKSVWTKDFAH